MREPAAASPEELRYPIGEFSPPERLSPEEIRAAVDSLESAPARLRAAVAGLSDEQLDTAYRPGGWSARQVAHHLPDSHMNSFIRFKLGLTEEHPTIRTYHEERWAELADARAPVEISLELLDALHRRWVVLLRSLGEKEWARTIDHPDMGPMRLDALLAFYAWHGEHHVAHIRSLRERQGW